MSTVCVQVHGKNLRPIQGLNELKRRKNDQFAPESTLVKFEIQGYRRQCLNVENRLALQNQLLNVARQWLNIETLLDGADPRNSIEMLPYSIQTLCQIPARFFPLCKQHFFPYLGQHLNTILNISMLSTSINMYHSNQVESSQI